MSKKFKEFKVGDIVNKKQAIEIIENGGKILRDNFIYYKDKNILMFIDTTYNSTDLSSGYQNLVNRVLTIQELPKNQKKQPNTIRHIVDSKNNTIVILPDGRKGVAKLHPGDLFDEYEGLRIAIARTYGVEPFPKTENIENEKDDDFKVGDYIYYMWNGRYCTCQIEKIEGDELWGYWNRYACDFEKLPTSLEEFNSMKRSDDLNHMNKQSVKKFYIFNYKTTTTNSELLKTIEELEEKINIMKDILGK